MRFLVNCTGNIYIYVDGLSLLLCLTEHFSGNIREDCILIDRNLEFRFIKRIKCIHHNKSRNVST